MIQHEAFVVVRSAVQYQIFPLGKPEQLANEIANART